MVDLMDFLIVDGDEFDAGHLECPVPGCHWAGDDFWSSSTTIGDLIAEATAHRAAYHPVGAAPDSKESVTAIEEMLRATYEALRKDA